MIPCGRENVDFSVESLNELSGAGGGVDSDGLRTCQIQSSGAV